MLRGWRNLAPALALLVVAGGLMAVGQRGTAAAPAASAPPSVKGRVGLALTGGVDRNNVVPLLATLDHYGAHASFVAAGSVAPQVQRLLSSQGHELRSAAGAPGHRSVAPGVGVAAGDIVTATPAELPALLVQLQSQGLRVVTISELVRGAP